jgi:hypothetical protein
MSDIPSGGANIFMAANTSGNFFVHFLSPGWPGNVLVQAQPFNTGVKMTCVPGSITRLSDDTFKFFTKISLGDGESTHFNIQASTS